jgi:hypothetical protein
MGVAFVMAKNKKHSSPMPMVTKAKKKLFLTRLAEGDAPGCAATAVGIDRSTAYLWRKSDAKFAVDWENAVGTSLDKLETEMYNIAKADPDNVGPRIKAIELTLKARRPREWGSHDNDADRSVETQNNYFLNVPMEEHIERLKRLGLPVPVIEADYEILDDEKK